MNNSPLRRERGVVMWLYRFPFTRESFDKASQDLGATQKVSPFSEAQVQMRKGGADRQRLHRDSGYPHNRCREKKRAPEEEGGQEHNGRALLCKGISEQQQEEPYISSAAVEDPKKRLLVIAVCPGTKRVGQSSRKDSG